jgi:hypothetical protein
VDKIKKWKAGMEKGLQVNMVRLRSGDAKMVQVKW